MQLLRRRRKRKITTNRMGFGPLGFLKNRDYMEGGPLDGMTFQTKKHFPAIFPTNIFILPHLNDTTRTFFLCRYEFYDLHSNLRLRSRRFRFVSAVEVPVIDEEYYIPVLKWRGGYE